MCVVEVAVVRRRLRLLPLIHTPAFFFGSDSFSHFRKPVDRRTCKHLLEHLGAEFDRWRCGPDGGVYTPAPKQDIPKLLLANKWEESISPVGWWMYVFFAGSLSLALVVAGFGFALSMIMS